MANVGIDNDFIKQECESVTEETSALFILTSEAIIDRVGKVFEGMDFEFIAPNLFLRPSDIALTVTIGVNLAHNNAGLLAALPLLFYLLFYRRAQRVMTKVRDWMNANSWLSCSSSEPSPSGLSTG